MNNPWLQLPTEPPFVLAEDAPYLIDNRDELTRLQLHVPPHPFAGCPARSRVLLLLLNPGYDGTDVTDYEQDAVYRRMIHGTFDFTNEPPMWCLDERIAHTGAFKWLSRITRRLAQECGLSQLQQHLMQVQYIAYKSRSYRHNRQLLPSQHFSFQLVREAMAAGKEIVIMRSRRRWLEAIPELAHYQCIEVKIPRAPYLTPNNLPEGCFDRLVRALA